MFKCIDCGYEQESGNFCGDCGTKFKETNVILQARSPARLTKAKQTEPNIHLEKLKMQVKAYRSYFFRHFKKPALAYESDEDGFANSLISILLLGIIIALSLFTSHAQTAPNFLSFFSGALLLCLLAIGISVLSLLLITTFLGPQQPIKTIIHLYGTHVTPLIVGAAASLLLFLLKAFLYGNLILGLVFLFAILFVPLYLLCTVILRNPTTTDPLYIFIFYLIAYAVLFSIFAILIDNSVLSVYLSELMYWFA